MRERAMRSSRTGLLLALDAIAEARADAGLPHLTLRIPASGAALRLSSSDGGPQGTRIAKGGDAEGASIEGARFDVFLAKSSPGTFRSNGLPRTIRSGCTEARPTLRKLPQLFDPRDRRGADGDQAAVGGGVLSAAIRSQSLRNHVLHDQVHPASDRRELGAVGAG